MIFIDDFCFLAEYNAIFKCFSIKYFYFAKTLKKYGGIDIFVSNAATNPSFGPLFDVSYIT